MTAHGLVGVADAGAFLARLARLDRAAPVRLRAAGGRTALWARLPWEVLVTREVAGAGPTDAVGAGSADAVGAGSADAVGAGSADAVGAGLADVTVSAAELLAVLARGGDQLPARRDEQWRWPLPPAAAETVESISGAELARLAAAAAGTLREVSAGALGDRSIGQRAVRDALLDHVALTVTPPAGKPVEVPQRLVQAISRMGFLGPDGADGPETRVRTAGRWVGLSAPYGVAWLQKVGKLTVVPIGVHPKG